jgi:hypothetical protein
MAGPHASDQISTAVVGRLPPLILGSRRSFQVTVLAGLAPRLSVACTPSRAPRIFHRRQVNRFTDLTLNANLTLWRTAHKWKRNGGSERESHEKSTALSSF